MNLLTNQWIPVLGQSGESRFISPLELTDPSDPPCQLDAVRPDFDGALAQFLIGLFSTYLAPTDDDQWSNRLARPFTRAELEAAWLPHAAGFELLSESGPAFMQDLDPTLGGGSAVELEGLLIDAPGANTIEQNGAHFAKPREGFSAGLATAAQMLLTLQINAPSGGAGHRTGLRGGGPLTTLLWPQCRRDGMPTTLFEKLWCNVLQATDDDNATTALPWCAPTKVSDGKPPALALGNNFWCFWATPRRIRLLAGGVTSRCELDPRLPAGPVVIGYRTKNYGANYPSERYLHPLSPYYWLKKDNAWLPLHPKATGFGYRDWLALACGARLSDQAGIDGERRAATVLSWSGERAATMRHFFGAQQRALWAFGFEMDNMKALAWHSASLPVLLDLGPNATQRVATMARPLIDAANAAADALGRALRQAWFERRDGDTLPARNSFFDRTEAPFYQHLDQVRLDTDTAAIKAQWQLQISAAAKRVFEEFAETATPANDGRLSRVKRTALAYRGLCFSLHQDVAIALGIAPVKAKKTKTKTESTEAV